MTLYEESRKIWLKMDSEKLAELKMKAIETYRQFKLLKSKNVRLNKLYKKAVKTQDWKQAHDLLFDVLRTALEVELASSNIQGILSQIQNIKDYWEKSRQIPNKNQNTSIDLKLNQTSFKEIINHGIQL